MIGLELNRQSVACYNRTFNQGTPLKVSPEESYISKEVAIMKSGESLGLFFFVREICSESKRLEI